MSEQQVEKCAGVALRETITGLGGCLAMAAELARQGQVRRAAGYVLGALDDLEPELTLLSAIAPENR